MSMSFYTLRGIERTATMTIEDLALVPLFLGALIMLVTIALSNRRTGEARRRFFAIGAILSLVAVSGGILTIWVPKIFIGGDVAWVVPALLATVIVVMALFYAAAGLKPRPDTAAAQFADSRRYGTLIAVVSGSLAIISLYALGFFLGGFVDQVQGGELRVVLAFAGVGIALVAFVPVVVLKVRAAGRRSRIRDGHPASDEVAEHAMRLVEEKELKALELAFTSPVRRLFLYGIAFVTITLVPLIMDYIVAVLPGGTGASIDLSVVNVVAPILGFVVAAIGVIDLFARPSILDAQYEYELAALSDEERLRIQSRKEGAPLHRFPGRLADPNRSIRVLALGMDGATRLERVATSTLLRAESGDITPNEDVDAADDDFEPTDFEDVSQEMVDAATRMAERLGRADLAELGLVGFDAFEPRDGEVVYVVARTDDDYADFPEELGSAISGEASA